MAYFWGPGPPQGPQDGPRDPRNRFKILQKNFKKLGWKCQISATALARLACKGVLVMLGFLCLVIFYDFGAFGGSRIPHSAVSRAKLPPHPNRPRRPPFSSFFGCLFGSLFTRSWLGFPPQFASQYPPHSMKSRCQEALYVGLQICIDVFPIFTPNLDPRILETYGFPLGKTFFLLTAS